MRIRLIKDTQPAQVDHPILPKGLEGEIQSFIAAYIGLVPIRFDGYDYNLTINDNCFEIIKDE